MAYQVLARKYRPQRFSDVYGQDHVTRTLTNALTQNRIAHGYIFSGHRGIGKTTIARILAMALDCRTAVGTDLRPTVEPCLQCVSCKEIASGGNASGDLLASNSFDFIEIDAASNRGIDDVRSITAQADVRPARDKYKIFLLDEAHQITDAAFNAILKTLEEPPDWAIFMMATTEPESIPQTIRSRCQHFSFHAVKFDDILAQLKSIAEKEGVIADDAALALLAEAGDGSMRDALSIMDQAIASAPLENGVATLQAGQIRELMGSVPNTVFERLMESVSSQQSAALMQDLDKLISSGNSPSALARQLVRYLRNCLMAKLGGEQTALLEIAQDERARAARTALLFTEDELTRNLQIALRTFDELNYRQEQRFHLELGMLKLIQAQRLLPVEEILSGLATQSSTRRPAPPATPQPTRPGQSSPSQSAPSRPAAPSLSPFAASTQRYAESSNTPPTREVPKASITVSEPVSQISPSETIAATTEQPISEIRSSSAPAITMAAPAAITEGAGAGRDGFQPIHSSPGSMAPNPSESIHVVPEPLTRGSLALAEDPIPQPIPDPKPGPEIVPSITAVEAQNASESENNDATDPIRNAVVEALTTGGHATAATILDDGKWTLEPSSVRIEVGAKATMIRITFNAAAEKLIRQALTATGAPSRFLIVPGESRTSGPVKSRIPLGSIENEARTNPLILKAQSLFHAEIVTVVDLREK
jgi:DNA polymerase III subunit gamma/tau